MDRLTKRIVAWAISDWEQTENPVVRGAYGRLEGWLSIVVNLLLGAFKGVLGFLFGSAGLVADAIHSFSDMATSVVVIVGFRVSVKPPDREHPYGHAKAEYVATLIVALLMVVAGYQVAESTLLNLIGGAPVAGGLALSWPLFLILCGLMLSKELLSRFSMSLGRMIDSNALAADGWHHRTDALSTGVIILGLAGRNVGIYWLDGVAAILVAAWIIYTGLKLGYDSISPLLGEQLPRGTLREMKNLVQAVPGVVSAHDLAVHRYGYYYFTTVHVELSDRMDVHRMHEITVSAETRILKRYPGQCVVHVDPVNLHHPLLHEISDLLRDVVVTHADLVEFRDLNLWNREGREQGDVEVTVEPEIPKETYSQLRHEIQNRITNEFPELDFSVRLTVDFTATPML